MALKSLRQLLATTTGVIAAFLSLTGPATAQAADELVLAIQPILNEAQTRKAFQPLCDYLANVTGQKCRLHTSPNFYAYWDLVRRGTGYNLAFDAAHFTDYRTEKHGFEVLAKVPDSVTYSLVTRPDALVIEPGELTGRRVATLGVPSIGAARLNAMFPNPSRQPVVQEIDDAVAGMKMLSDKRVNAAIVPTPIVSQLMAQGGEFMVVMTTEAIPHIALSASPSLSAGLRTQIRTALVQASKTADGQAMLKQIGFERLDPANAAMYQGQAKILKAYWGY
jgi:ABC-type phosphate/phosphonate transport system substrate-binding protein